MSSVLEVLVQEAAATGATRSTWERSDGHGRCRETMACQADGSSHLDKVPTLRRDLQPHELVANRRPFPDTPRDTQYIDDDYYAKSMFPKSRSLS